jgi:hypothetical protein
VRAVDDADHLSRGLWKGRPTAMAVPGAPVDNSLASAGRRRFHVTSWQELDGQRFDEEESWIEGPVGTGVAIGVGDFNNSAQVLGWMVEKGGTARLDLAYSIRLLFGASRRRLPLYEEGVTGDNLMLLDGAAATIRLLGPARPGEPERMLRIEGPFAAAPIHAVAWDSTPPSARGFRLNPYNQTENPPELRMRGIRWSRHDLRRAHLYAWGVYRMPHVILRVSLAGRPDAAMVDYPTSGERIFIPGVQDSVEVWMKNPPWAWSGGSGNCFRIRRLNWRALERDRARGQAPFRAEGCFDPMDLQKPVEVVASNGQRLRVMAMVPAEFAARDRAREP